MHVMYVAGNPQGMRTLEIEREIHGLQTQFDRGAGSDPIVFRAYAAMPAHDLGDTIRRFEPDVLHISAHGHADALVLSEPGRDAVLLDGGQLAAMLINMPRRPKLVVVNACASAGIAAALARAGVAPFVIGTDAPVTNLAARAMVEALYQRLAAASSIGDAFEVARAQLALIDGGNVTVALHPEGSIDAARMVRLVDPLRILACLPKVDAWLEARLTEPDRGFRPEQPVVQLGVAGMPVAARQTVLFTDDETVVAKKDKPGQRSLEEARSWIVLKQADQGEVWMPDAYPYWGDMAWFAAVTTNDGRLVSCASTTVAALRRYYFEEAFQGDLPDAIRALVETTIRNLEGESGSRRARGSRRRSPAITSFPSALAPAPGNP